MIYKFALGFSPPSIHGLLRLLDVLAVGDAHVADEVREIAHEVRHHVDAGEGDDVEGALHVAADGTVTRVEALRATSVRDAACAEDCFTAAWAIGKSSSKASVPSPRGMDAICRQSKSPIG